MKHCSSCVAIIAHATSIVEFDPQVEASPITGLERVGAGVPSRSPPSDGLGVSVDATGSVEVAVGKQGDSGVLVTAGASPAG